MRVGIMGGTFDPIHFGHLIAAEEAGAALDLAEVVIVPAGRSPFKGEPETPAPDRLAMIELAIRGNSRLRADRIELDRPPPSYTVDTVAELCRRWGREVEVFFIAGVDAVADLPAWHDPCRLLSLCRMVAMSRPGGRRLDWEALEAAVPGARERIVALPMPLIGISATDLRRRVRQGLPIKYQVPAAVEEYIVEKGLYR